MKKYLFHRDTLIATVFLFLVLWLLSVTIRTGIMEPGNMQPYDFDYTDLIFSLSGKARTSFDKHFVIIDIGDTDRAGIAAVMQKVRRMGPSVIGMDVAFNGRKDHTGDSLLAEAINGTYNLVLGSELGATDDSNYFLPYSAHRAYINFAGENGNVVRYFKPFQIKDPKKEDVEDTSFAASIVHISSPGKFRMLSRNDTNFMAINYTRRDSEYFVVNYRKLFDGSIDDNAIRNKIVLLGFYSNDKFNIEDKHLTPMNPVFIGRSLPDMHGVIIHANIISMMLDDNYIHESPAWLNNIFALIIGWLCTGIFIKYIANKHIWFHITVKIWQSLILFLMLAVGLLLLKYCRIKIDLNYIIVVMLFSIEILYIYEMFSLWLARTFNHRTIFKHE